MQFMIKKIYVTNELLFMESDVKSNSDLAYIIHKKLQHYPYHQEELIENTMYLAQVYVRNNENDNWKLAFESTSPDPEDEPLKEVSENE
jgi:hypothetical protein